MFQLFHLFQLFRFVSFCFVLLRFASFCFVLLRFASFCFALLCFALLCFALLCFALLCFALLCFALLCFALLCFALLCFALLCFALLCFALLCFALLCFALLCFALLCFALLCFALLCFALLCFALLCFALLCFALLCFALLLFCFVLFCFVLFCFVLFCFVLFCFVLFCFVLFCFVLCCFVLFCFVLFCFVLFCFVCLFVCFCDLLDTRRGTSTWSRHGRHFSTHSLTREGCRRLHQYGVRVLPFAEQECALSYSLVRCAPPGAVFSNTSLSAHTTTVSVSGDSGCASASRSRSTVCLSSAPLSLLRDPAPPCCDERGPSLLARLSTQRFEDLPRHSRHRLQHLLEQLLFSCLLVKIQMLRRRRVHVSCIVRQIRPPLRNGASGSSLTSDHLPCRLMLLQLLRGRARGGASVSGGFWVGPGFPQFDLPRSSDVRFSLFPRGLPPSHRPTLPDC